ncbi:recombination protein RecR [Candidatus Peregrinibacteria bacterium HGW-Peregrinibacteria-1]|jgi:recombination protein RecR|nr:MAG: recombination protein RecR [Candidatus Peregrinibacteria bacterium HGW-Peregrinibacteria-1]
MNNFLPESVRNLINELSRLPGIGPKSAQRLAIHLLHSPDVRLRPLGESILNLRERVCFCERCFNVAEGSPCGICEDEGRENSLLCVVESILDVVAIEKTGKFNGKYHVLHGVLSPVEGVGPEKLKMTDLFRRVEDLVAFGSDVEVLLATNPSLEGEATALYIQNNLRHLNIQITRIARGLPMGGDLDYADEVTLSRAIEGRRAF